MLSLLLPRCCVHCKAPARSSDRSRFWGARLPFGPLRSYDAYLCESCDRQFAAGGRPQSKELLLQLTQLHSLPDYLSVDAFRYFEPGGVVQSLVHAVKYQQMPRLARLLGFHLATTLGLERNEFDLIIPVPLHRTRIAERGFNQSDEIVNGIARKMGLTRPRMQILARVRATRSQTSLSPEERFDNVDGAFRLTPGAKRFIFEKRVLLVDDVMTTGSTLMAAAHELDQARPTSLRMIAVAAVDGRNRSATNALRGAST